ncbi:MAG: hypothetical protein RR967_02980 [Anaerovoracaceae bacterium]
MKRISAIICLTVIMVISLAPVALAGSFGVDKISPTEGEKGIPLENLGVKVFFNEEVYNKDNEKNNAKACKLVDNKGKEVPTVVIFNPSDKKVALILADTSKKNLVIKPTTKYTLTIDQSFVSANDEPIGKEIKTSFETLNPSDSMKISMGMMGVMVVGMVFASVKQTKKKAAENAAPTHEEKFNPYKVAKETGKSLETVIAEEKKRQAKIAKKKQQAEENKVEISTDNFRVKGPRPISAAGSTYITGRKAEAEAKAAAKAAAREARKNPQKKKSQNPKKHR